MNLNKSQYQVPPVGRMVSSLKVFLLLVTAALLFGSCSKKDSVNPEPVIEPSSKQDIASVSANGHYFIAACNMANNKIEIYDSENYTSFDQSGSFQWSWSPTTALGYTAAEVSAWAHPYSVQRRASNIWPGSTEVWAATCRDGLATICRFVGGTRGQKLWAKDVGSDVYPHGIEVLPNGNVAIAGRKNGPGGWVRVYASSQGPNNGTYANYNLDWAHGVLWDPGLNRLWAIGELPGGSDLDILVGLIVGGTAAAPTLTEDMSMRVTLPSTGGHDVSAYYGYPNLLLVSDHLGVYKYNKTTKVFTALPGAANRTDVKSISNQKIGHIVQAKPNKTLCSLNDWCTIKAEFYDGTTGAWIYNRTRTGAAFYKTDVWWWEYQNI